MGSPLRGLRLDLSGYGKTTVRGMGCFAGMFVSPLSMIEPDAISIVQLQRLLQSHSLVTRLDKTYHLT